MIIIEHRFKKMCIDIDALFEGNPTFTKFIANLKKQSIKQINVNPGYWDNDKYFGEGFEAFCECFIKSSTYDKRVNIDNYSPCDAGSDMGIDGTGLTHSGKIHTVQCKAKSNANETLTANRDHLSNFVAKSAMEFGDNLGALTIMTSGKDVHSKILKDMYHKDRHYKFNVIGNTDFKKFLDNNLPFWRDFKESLKN